ncbi:MAG TPA: insulinase family protein, partial [Desulfobacterales bacterium]|nr:insulinase family protein [Desulfobacterales bacterium]
MSARWFKSFFIGFFVWAVVFPGIGLFQAADLKQHKENKELLCKYAGVFPSISNAASGGVDQMPCWPHEKSDLYPDPALLFGKLPNGFRYVLMENHEPKARVSMHLNIQTGSMNEADHEQGLAHFLEHML